MLMNLQQLIENKLLKNFSGASIQQIRKRFELGIAYLTTAKNNFGQDKKDKNRNKIVYTNIYDSIRIIGESFLLLNGYKATLQYHHKTVLAAAKLLMNNEELDLMFMRFDKMRKMRHSIDYDIDDIDVSDANIIQAIKDTELLVSRVNAAINQKDTQQNLL